MSETSSRPFITRRPSPAKTQEDQVSRATSRWTLAYYACAAVCTLWLGAFSFSSMAWQVSFAEARSGFAHSGEAWSAPLDDVFIHFDFARSLARGYPFEWSEGNGYSSGATSMPYPVVLALGLRLGYDSLALVHWAGILACLCVFALFAWSRPLFRELPGWTLLLLPPVVLSAGSLSWSLYSGMELAFFMACFGLCVVAWYRLVDEPRFRALRALPLGLAGAALVAARPEAALVVAVLTISATLHCWPTRSPLERLATLGLGAAPGAVYVVSSAIVNKLFTGEWSAAGALVKLVLTHPNKTTLEKLEAWLANVEYQFDRFTSHHLMGDGLRLGETALSLGPLGWLLAAVPLFFRQTRIPAALLWLCALAWIAVVALNTEVRSHNDRYSMPALAWLLLAMTLGLGALAARGARACADLWRRAPWSASTLRRLLLGVWGTLAGAAFFAGQSQRFADQVWSFGRASRNIYEQQIAAGRAVRDSKATRVLVGDAGAIPFVSDLPALDLIGLGGYHQFPFARASRYGTAAALELVQRLPPQDRPDLMAIYPSWWSDLPAWFGEPLATFSARGNVICGAVNKVLYRPDWTALDNSTTPFHRPRRLRIVDELDTADLSSERATRFRLEYTVGKVNMKLLPHPEDPKLDAWDAGRRLLQGSRAHFTLSGFRAHEPAELVLRFAPATSSTLRIGFGESQSVIELRPTDAWLEERVEVPAHAVREANAITVEVTHGTTELYHVWGLQQ